MGGFFTIIEMKIIQKILFDFLMLICVIAFIFLGMGLVLFFQLFREQIEEGGDWLINFFAFFNIWIWFLLILIISGYA